MDNLPVSAQEVLALSKMEPKGDYRTYSRYKRRLEYLSLSREQYEASCRKLVRIMEV